MYSFNLTAFRYGSSNHQYVLGTQLLMFYSWYSKFLSSSQIKQIYIFPLKIVIIICLS